MLRKKTAAPFRRAIHTAYMLVFVLVTGIFLSRATMEGGFLYASGSIQEGRSFIVVVDAGHGGIDGGAVGSKSKVAEAGLNLTVAKLVEEKLKQSGIYVLMTRTDENALAKGKKPDMQARKKIMNTEGVSVVVSIHMNKFTDSTVHGAMAFYMKDSEEGRKLAQFTIDAVCLATDQKPRKAANADFFMLRESPSPSVLVECGFLSNAKEEQKLLDPAYQEKLATGIVRGIIDYLKTLPIDEYEKNYSNFEGENDG
ncbi:MAG TPA: N-acetylmuramoyl-L-alanine amidase [Clostridia bacterium]|nr:N-acetylmuramoyl-L-alanine amidase [Clostridia bacterium]